MSKVSELPEAAAGVLEFWFDTLTPEQWWKRDDDVDTRIRERFSRLYESVSRHVPDDWLAIPAGRLAAVIVLDQFPRNMFRNDARAYGSDAAALALAEETIGMGWDSEIAPEKRAFLYMPYQHSEDAGMQARSVELFAALGDEENLDFAKKHKEIIDRFGRFPHRNSVLGRKSTPEEEEFLKAPGLFW